MTQKKKKKKTTYLFVSGAPIDMGKWGANANSDEQKE
jgi:hypothetical protein